MQNTITKEQVIFSHKDIYEVMSGTYPKTSEKIRASLLYKVGMVFGDKTADTIPTVQNNTFTPKNRKVKYDDMCYFVGEFFGDDEQNTLDSENALMMNLRIEAEELYDTAKKVCEITKKSFTEVIGFLSESPSSSISKNEPIENKISEVPQENIIKPEGLSEKDLKEIRDYVEAGANRKIKKKRRVEMATKFSISVRHVGTITAWTKKWENNSQKSETFIPAKNIATVLPETKTVSKRELLREYLDEFFEGNIRTPKLCAITYKDMHDCFCKDTGISIDYAEVPKIWQSLMVEQQGSGVFKERETERRLSISLVKSRRILDSGEFVIDKSCNVLLPNEIKEILELKK